MTAPVRFERVEPSHAFGALAPAWEELLRASTADTPFLTPAWLEPWCRAYARGREPALILARRGNDLAGIFPLQIVEERWRGRLPLRALRLLGDGTYDSDYLDFILPRGEEEPTIAAFWAWLRSGASPLRFDVAQWNEIPVSSPSYSIVCRLAAEDRTFLDEERVGCVVAPLPDSFEGWIATLKPRMRTKVRSLRRGLEEGHRTSLERSDAASVAPTLESLFRLHERRWAARGEAGVFTPEKRAFYHAVCASLLRRGWLDLSTLVVDGAPVAHQCCIRYGATAYLLQEGYDPDWEERGVGNVLRVRVFETMIGDGVRAYDFLGGVTSHKLSWGGTVKESARLAWHGSGARAALASGLVRLSAARARIRSALSRSAR